MDVSAVTRQLSRSAVATVAAAAAPAAVSDDTAAGPGPGDSKSSSGSAPLPKQHVDVQRAVAERLVANIDKPSPAAPAPAVSELWIPTWVRAAYAARARQGWFLPPPAALAGYSDDDAAEAATD